jgi:hypothetical protein
LSSDGGVLLLGEIERRLPAVSGAEILPPTHGDRRFDYSSDNGGLSEATCPPFRRSAEGLGVAGDSLSAADSGFGSRSAQSTDKGKK